MKQFSKIKHLADKALSKQDASKSDRTEVLSEDLLAAEKRIELIKKTCESTVKCLRGLHGSSKEGTRGINDETKKRVKSPPLCHLGYDMQENGHALDSQESADFNSKLGKVLTEAAQIEIKAGTEIMSYDGKVDGILQKLENLVQTDIHNISKTKKTLNKLTSDMDSAKAKLNQANNRHSMSASGSKIDNFKDDYDDTQQKVEQCKDNLAAEMYQLISRESEIAQYIHEYLKLQKEYHLTVYHVFDQLLPNVESHLETTSIRPVYGADLRDHLQCINRPIAYPIELCVCSLMLNGLEEEGLFRIAGSTSKVKFLKAAFDAGLLDLEYLRKKFSDPHVIANALKCYLRELSDPLLTCELYYEWMEAIKIQNNNNLKLHTLLTTVKRLPKANYDNLRYLIKFLSELSKHQGVNKMSPANIAIVIGPNILWMPNSDTSDDPMGMSNMTMTHFYTSIVEQFITHSDYFFGNEPFEFFQSYARPSLTMEQSDGLPNGSVGEVGYTNQQNENEGLLEKRSQSSGSLDDHNSPPHGSPKPFVRKKNKPAPVPPPALVKVPSQKQPVQHTESTSPKQNISSEGSVGEITPERVSSTKRGGMMNPSMDIPPSPSQTNNRKYSGSSASTEKSPTAGVVKVTPPPPKPPQPQFLQQKDGENKSSFSDGSKLVGQNYSSTLRHKSSFNSGVGTGDSHLSGSGGVGVAVSSSSSLQYSNSLPRHFQTENSYKNQRAPRPPSVFAPIPTVPSTFISSSDPSNHSGTDSKETVSQMPQPSAIGLQSAPQSDGVTIASGNIVTAELATNIKKPGSNLSSQHVPALGPSIGFEEIETEVMSTEGMEQLGNRVKDVALKMEEAAGGQRGSCENAKPVPAPRSSLLLHNINVNKEKEVGPKERPILMAKPRDLGKRSQPISTGTNPVTHGRGSSESTTPPEVTTPINAQQGIGFRVSVETDDYKDSGYLDDVAVRNGGVKDKSLPPPSPRAPNRPPRPQPPPPPKLKTESTDL